MDVSLTRDVDAIIEAKVASGRYSSASEVVEEALRLLEQRDATWESRRAEFEAEINRRIDSLERGEGIPGEQIEAYFHEKAAKRRQQAA